MNTDSTAIVAVLSCNGGTVTVAARLATRLFVATLNGVRIFDRDLTGAWQETGSALNDLHISCILYEPRSKNVFAGAHWGSGLFKSSDGGATFKSASAGIKR